MALEKSIIKAEQAPKITFDFKPRDLTVEAPEAAKSFVDNDAFRSKDFRISELVAQQTGISKMESDSQLEKINLQVLDRLKEVQEKAYQEGYDLGLIEGTEKAFKESKSDLEARLKTLDDMLRRIENLKSQLLIDQEAEIVQLVFLVAKRMAMRDLKDNREAVREILSALIGEAQTNEHFVVRLSPEDLYFLETLQEKTQDRLEEKKRVKLVATDGITSGGCIIETQHGNVDATVEERVERTWQTLYAKIPQKAQDPTSGGSAQ